MYQPPAGERLPGGDCDADHISVPEGRYGNKSVAAQSRSGPVKDGWSRCKAFPGHEMWSMAAVLDGRRLVITGPRAAFDAPPLNGAFMSS